MAIAVVPPSREDKWDKWIARALVVILLVAVALAVYRVAQSGVSL